MEKKGWYRLLAILAIFLVCGWIFLDSKPKYRTYVAKPEGIIRLHILANSDSPKDQALKLKVRDAVVAYLTPKMSKVYDPVEARSIIGDNREEILRIARIIIDENGADYPVIIETGWFDFPIRSYGTVVVPAGKYEAVRILIGAAAGKNWWCVLFPPLCFVDGSGGVAVPVNANQNQVPAKVEIRWKVAELLHEWENK
ncbi:MAG: stage sporulation protein [Firmicutes bacterium]|nr:stage sporulation protein [Bacillota bacterium]